MVYVIVSCSESTIGSPAGSSGGYGDLTLVFPTAERRCSCGEPHNLFSKCPSPCVLDYGEVPQARGRSTHCRGVTFKLGGRFMILQEQRRTVVHAVQQPRAQRRQCLLSQILTSYDPTCRYGSKYINASISITFRTASGDVGLHTVSAFASVFTHPCSIRRLSPTQGKCKCVLYCGTRNGIHIFHI